MKRKNERRVGIGRRASDSGDEDDDTIEVHIKDRIATPIFVLLCISVALNAVGLLGIGFITADTGRVVADIEEQNSPESIAEQQEMVDSIILRVECGSRAAFEDALNGLLDELERENILRNGAVEVLNGRCDDVLPPPTTTTTTP